MPEFKVLGALEVMSRERIYTPSPPKVRRVLALLVVRANRVVHIDDLIEELWGPRPPKSAVTTVQTYIYHLRKVFEREHLNPPHKELLFTKSPGYVFRIEDDQVDSKIFERLVSQGQVLLDKGHADQASEVLRGALDMWTGPALANVFAGSVLRAHVVYLEERRIGALELRIQADMELGRYRSLIGELRSLVTVHPLHEWFHEQLITVLTQAGRRGEALQAYQQVRRNLSDELGVDPSPQLQRLQHQVLSLGARGPAGQPPA
jgi:DNA-binding SARP family transcriptional activator